MTGVQCPEGAQIFSSWKWRLCRWRSGSKTAGEETDHSCPYSVEVKTAWSFNFSLIRLYGMHNFTILPYVCLQTSHCQPFGAVFTVCPHTANTSKRAVELCVSIVNSGGTSYVSGQCTTSRHSTATCSSSATECCITARSNRQVTNLLTAVKPFRNTDLDYQLGQQNYLFLCNVIP